jgi:DNA-binding XRE family transcriptional regulator
LKEVSELNIKKYLYKKQFKISDGIFINKWTWQSLADTLGVSRQTLWKWETGKSKPNMEQALELAKLLGVSFAKLIKEDNNET